MDKPENLDTITANRTFAPQGDVATLGPCPHGVPLQGRKMDGSLIGFTAAHDPGSGRFLNGNSEYRAKQRRIADRLAQLLLDYDPSPSQRQLLAVAARHLDDADKGRTALTRTRASNAARRLLAGIPRKPEPQLPPLAELLMAE
jgi:hypothetical protein